MVIQIVVEHSVKSGKEQEVLDVIRKLNKRGHGDRADALWSNLLLLESQADQVEEKLTECANDKAVELVDTWAPLLKNPAKIRLRLSI
jgi:hypothetical protein